MPSILMELIFGNISFCEHRSTCGFLRPWAESAPAAQKSTHQNRQHETGQPDVTGSQKLVSVHLKEASHE